MLLPLLLKSKVQCSPYTPLIDPALRFQFTDTFAFGAPKVIGHFLSIWMITYADKVIINGMFSRSCLPTLLYASEIGHHTSVLFINKANGSFTITRYTWQHDSQRPNTHTFPLACPICHALQPWCPPGAVKRQDGDAFTLQCMTKTSQGGKVVRCPGTYEVGSRPSSSLLKPQYVGEWYSSKLDCGVKPMVSHRDNVGNILPLMSWIPAYTAS